MVDSFITDYYKTIMHMDANSAYLSWEAEYRLQHGYPLDLRKIPSIVGGNQATRHGIVLAKSIPCKAYSITTGMSIMEARLQYPKLVVVPVNYPIYMQASCAMFEIFNDYFYKVQRFSIDEGFGDFTGMERILGNPWTVAHEIKDRVKNELGFTINIGISCNKLLAKMAGDLKKPDMVHTLYPHEIPTKLWPLPVGNLYMCGPQSVPKLNAMGIYTIGDLAHADIEYLKYKLKSHGLLLYKYAHGIEDSEVHNNGTHSHIPIKGIGNSQTIHFDVTDTKTAHMVLLSLIETVGMRLRHGGYCARLVNIGIKTNELKRYSHQRKLVVPINATNAIYQEAKNLFNKAWKGEPIRHLEVRVSELCGDDFIQMSMLEKNWEKQLRIDKAVDAIRLKYGSKSIIRGCFPWSGLSPIQGGISEEFPIMTSIL